MARARSWPWLSRTNDLPLPVILAFFLISWMEAFPVTAMTSFLSEDIGMSIPTITTYYTMIFLPFTWKPFFGWVSDTFPIAGFHRTPYIMFSAVGCAAALLTTAWWVKSAWEIFVVSTLLSVCSAFLQLMVGGFLVDVARKDVRKSVSLQAVAYSAQWLGSMTSQLMALALYAHGGQGSGKSAIRARPAIAMTSVAPIVIAVMSPFLPEARATSASISCRERCACSREVQLYGATVVVIQLNVMLFGIQSLMAAAAWRLCVIIAVPVSVLLVCVLFCVGRRRRARSEALVDSPEEALQQSTCWWIRLCLFCFAVNALPKTSVVMSQFQYASFTPESFQALSIISSATSAVAAYAFAASSAFQGWGAVRLIAVTTVVAAVSKLALWPFAALAIHEVGEQHGLWSTVGALGLGSTVLSSFTSMFTVLPVEGLITAASGSVAVDRSCTAYSVLLSCYNFGSTVGGLIAAPLLRALGLDKQHWATLPVWVVSVAVMQLLTLALLPLVPRGRRSEPETPSAVEDREHLPVELGR